LLASPRWTMQTSGVNVRLRGVSAVNERVAWASGGGATVLRTVDGGATWQKLNVTDEALDFRDVDAIDTDTAYVLSIGNGPSSRIYKTTDAGKTWQLQFKNDDQKAFLDAMSFWDADHGIAFGDSVDLQFYILTTDNGGRTWSRVSTGNLPPALGNEGAFAASGTNIAIFGKTHAWIGTGAAAKSRVLRTSDRGRTWQVADTPLASGGSAGIFSIAFRDAQHGVIAGGDYKKEQEAVDNLAVTSDGLLYARPSLHRRADEPRFISYDDIVAVEAARGFTAHSGKLLIYHQGGACTQITGIRSSTVHDLAALIDGQLRPGQRAG